MGLSSLHPVRHGFVSGRGGASLDNINAGHSLIIPKSLIGVIRKLKLTTNLKLCLDAGDASSYDPGVQTDKWLDIAGSGYDFFRGATTGADAADPTFNGSAGGLSSADYWSFDGGDYFTYDTTNEAWMNNFHKDNAKWTIIQWYYPASNAAHGFCGTGENNTANVGFSLRRVVTTEVIRLRVFFGGGSAIDVSTTITAPNLAWNFVAVSQDEAVGAGGLLFKVNGNTETFTSTYTTPSAAAATYTLQIGAQGNAFGLPASGARMGGVMMWEGTALTAAQLAAIYTATRGRYGV